MTFFFQKHIGALLAVALLAQACTPSIEAPNPGAGPVDFSNYIAVGNSLTAGFSNGTSTGGGLYRSGQLESYPLILANAMNATGSRSGEFLQPLFPEGNGSGYSVLDAVINGVPTLRDLPPDLTQIETPSPLTFKDITNGYEIHNLGVPGIKLADINTPGYGSALGNLYFERMLPDADQFTSYLSYVAKRKPTFFTSWLGNNDILGYTTGGAASGSITSQEEFEALYRQMLDTLLRKTPQGVTPKGLIATIPNVTSAPYFTTVPVNCIVLTTQGQVDALNTGYVPYNARIDQINVSLPEGGKLAKITFKLGANAAVIAVPDPIYAPLGGLRQANTGELILLTAASVLPLGRGSAIPLDNRFVLTATELVDIDKRANEINTFIRTIAKDKGLALFDATEVLERVKAGTYFFDGTRITARFISGGAFSLDGIHATSRGYALIANEMMKAINTTYGSSLSPVNVGDYTAVTLPK